MNRTPSQQAYDEYLKSAHWLRLRSQAIEVQGCHCQVCGDRRITAHHMSYPTHWLAPDHVHTMLVILCFRCHDLAHGLLNDQRLARGDSREITIAAVKRRLVEVKLECKQANLAKHKQGIKRRFRNNAERFKILEQRGNGWYSKKERKNWGKAKRAERQAKKRTVTVTYYQSERRVGGFDKMADGRLIYNP